MSLATCVVGFNDTHHLAGLIDEADRSDSDAFVGTRSGVGLDGALEASAGNGSNPFCFQELRTTEQEGVRTDTTFNDARSRRCSEDISVRWDDEGMMWLADRLMKREQS